MQTDLDHQTPGSPPVDHDPSRRMRRCTRHIMHRFARAAEALPVAIVLPSARARRHVSDRTRSLLAMVGTSRHSAMVAARERVEVVRPFSVRAFALACGSTMIGAAVSLLVMADLGLPPYDVLSSGVAAHTGLTLGRSSWLLAGLLFLLASVLGRRPSAWGIAFILANGFAVDASADLLNAPASMPGRVLFLAAGILVMATGVSVVLYSGITGGPFELLMRAGEDRGVSATTVRYGLDLAVLVVGIIIGGAFGIGTMIFAALMGVVLQVLKRALLDHRTGRALRLNGSATSAS